MTKRAETDIGQSVMEWLRADGWSVYPEFRPRMRDVKTADIVAIRDRIVWIIECKTSINLAVIGQSLGWVKYAHYVSVAGPRASAVARKILKDYGIGLLSVEPLYYRSEVLKTMVTLKPRLNRFAKTHIIRESVHPLHEGWDAVPGQVSGGTLTPFRITAQLAIAYVMAHPGCTVKEVVDNIKHHYRCDSTARSCLVSALRRKIIPELRIDPKSRPMRIYPSDP